jgi:hypothetical protein
MTVAKQAHHNLHRYSFQTKKHLAYWPAQKLCHNKVSDLSLMK